MTWTGKTLDMYAVQYKCLMTRKPAEQQVVHVYIYCRYEIIYDNYVKSVKFSHMTGS